MTDGPCSSQPKLLLPPVKTRTKDKYRVVYTDHQRLELEKEFHYSRYITIRRKAELAATLGLSERQVGTTLLPCTWSLPWMGSHLGRGRSQVEGLPSSVSRLKQQDGERFLSEYFF